MASGFKILDHPADIGFMAWAENLPDLFVQSALALTSIIVDINTIGAKERTEVEVNGDDLESLMYSWLAEILYFFDGEGKVIGGCLVRSLETKNEHIRLIAELIGESFNTKKHQIKTYVKAITFHQLAIEGTTDGYSARVFLDI